MPGLPSMALGVTLYNSSNPSNGGFRGRLWTDNGWVAGTHAVGFDAADDIGIQRMAIAVDADEHASDSSCDFTRTVPCPGSRGLDTTFNTAGFSDGGHALTFRSTDASGNVRTDAKQIFIDNTAPAAPSTPQLAGASSSTWRTVNGFTLTYANPSTGNGSESTSSDVQVCSVDAQGAPQMSTCTVIPSGAASGSNSFNVPSPGRFKARVRVNDRLYSGAWSEWSPLLLFDNVVPGEANPQIYNGWLSKEEIRAGMKIEPRRPRRQARVSASRATATTRDGSTAGTLRRRAAGDATDERPSISDSWVDGVYVVKSSRSLGRRDSRRSDTDVRSSTVRSTPTAPRSQVGGAPDRRRHD